MSEIYRVLRNPDSTNRKDRYMLRSYDPQQKVLNTLYIGPMEQCNKLMRQLSSGQLTRQQDSRPLDEISAEKFSDINALSASACARADDRNETMSTPAPIKDKSTEHDR